ncbi:MAG: alpha/beta hydrolase [Deltaproteobacteria bacterium]|nr:alpha/beta hydrolase [Deltaproteobacteria bacterium]
MPSREFIEFQKRAAAAPAADPPDTIEAVRAQIDATLGVQPLAEGVEAESVEVGGVPAIWLRPIGSDAAPILCYFHGGGYRMGSATAWRAYASHLSRACRARVLLVDYRLAPEHPFPAAVEDALATYAGLIQAGEPPARIVLAGDSAGGGLAAAALLGASHRGITLPAGLVCLSPWTDLTNRARSFETHAQSDHLFSLEQAETAASLYLAGHDPTDPLASPVRGDWQGLPPALIQVGDVEVLLDDAHDLAAKARAAAVDVQLSVYPGMPHVWQMNYPAFPEAVQAVEEIASFVAEVAGG